MDAIKTSPNVELDVIYDDGTRIRVPERFSRAIRKNGELPFHLGCPSVAAFRSLSDAPL